MINGFKTFLGNEIKIIKQGSVVVVGMYGVLHGRG